MTPVRIVGIGGGTGLPVLMRGLQAAERETGRELQLTAVACVSDDGGSSGRLRKAHHTPSVGDVRKCLMGFAERGFLSDLADHRFTGGRELNDHSVGNILLTALVQKTGSLREAARLLAQGLGLRGEVLPATEAQTTICAEGHDGRVARGETSIAKGGLDIRRVWLEPALPPPAPGLLARLREADVVVMGPGSLYTSVLPPLLVSGVMTAIRTSAALRIYVCNLATQRGETEGYGAAEHLRALLRTLGPDAVDVCIVNTRRPRGRVAQASSGTGVSWVVPDLPGVRGLGIVPVAADLLSQEGPGIRHRPDALGRLVIELAQARREDRFPWRGRGRTEGTIACVGSSAT